MHFFFLKLTTKFFFSLSLNPLTFYYIHISLFTSLVSISAMNLPLLHWFTGYCRVEEAQELHREGDWRASKHYWSCISLQKTSVCESWGLLPYYVVMLHRCVVLSHVIWYYICYFSDVKFALLYETCFCKYFCWYFKMS